MADPEDKTDASSPAEPPADSGDSVQDPEALAEHALAEAAKAVESLNEGAPEEASDPADDAADASTEQATGNADDAAAVLEGANVDMPNFQQVLADVDASGIDLLHDVDLHVKIELGRTHMLVEDVLKLAEGSVVELDKLAGDPVDVYVNDRLVARGEVLVLNDCFCVRVSDVVADMEELEDEANAEGDNTE
jgi:flagellar motor switch protein FliN/FliY